MLHELTAIDTVPGYYALAREQYGKFRVHPQRYEDYLDATAGEVVKKLWPDRKRSFSFIGIGSGDGSKDISFLDSVAKHLHRPTSEKIQIFTRAIEPSHGYLEIYSSRYASANADLLPTTLRDKAEIEFDFHAKTFQEYLEFQRTARNTRRSFDVALFADSLYYVDPVETLTHCYSKELGDCGAMVCALQGSDSLFHRVSRIFHDRYSDETIHHSMTSDDIVRVAEENEWSYDEYRVPNRIDVTDILDPDSQEGNTALDFLAYYKDFRMTADKDRVQSVMELIKGASREESGRLYVVYSWDVLVIYKGGAKVL